MISIGSKRVIALIDNFKIQIDSHWQEMKDRLHTLREGTNADTWQRRYVGLLLRKGRLLITATPTEIQEIKSDFDQIKVIDTEDKTDKAFKDQVLTALRYSARRADFYPKYFKNLKIKCCVYCNSQLCVTVDRTNEEPQAKFQVDHFIAKDRHPCLSVALFNLYPVCASCNNVKSTHSVPFRLYTDNPISPSVYTFSLKEPDKTLASYIVDRNPNVIQIAFNEPAVTGEDKLMNQLFSIKGIYDTQLDIVEELILKKHIYTDAYLSQLESLFPNKALLKRLVIGNYVEESEIHNRPLAKFIQDIALQLKLL